MKFLYHHRTAADDGQAVHIRELQAAMVRCGHEVREVALVARSGEANAHRRSRLGAILDHSPRFVRELAEQGYDVVGARKLRAAIDEFHPDALYERYALSTACGARVAAERGLPFVVEVNSPLVDEVSRTRGLSLPSLARRKERAVLRAATVVCVVSEELGRWAESEGVPRERVLLTPNGVDLARFAPGPKSAALVAQLGLAGKWVIGFTGFVRDWHRLDLALDAMARARLAERGAVLLVVGEGPARAALEARAAALGIRDAVRFTGQVRHAEVAEYVRLFDVALVTAINPYASPLKLFEYLGAAIPSVVVDQPNLREVVDDSSARFFKGGDADALARVLGDLLDRREESRALGESGRQLLIARDATWDGNVRRIVDALRRLRPVGARP